MWKVLSCCRVSRLGTRLIPAEIAFEYDLLLPLSRLCFSKLFSLERLTGGAYAEFHALRSVCVALPLVQFLFVGADLCVLPS